jgi:hypothetical protein
MSPYQQLLIRGAEEVREFERSVLAAKSSERDWLESLARRIEAASSLQDAEALEREVKAIARSIIDSGPAVSTFAPSFDRALDTMQRARKKNDAS